MRTSMDDPEGGLFEKCIVDMHWITFVLGLLIAQLDLAEVLFKSPHPVSDSRWWKVCVAIRNVWSSQCRLQNRCLHRTNVRICA